MKTVNNDRHLDPPEEKEAVFCEHCGQEKEWEYFPGGLGDGYYRCPNHFCPALFDTKSIQFQMAITIVDMGETIEDLKTDKKRLMKRLAELENQTSNKPLTLTEPE